MKPTDAGTAPTQFDSSAGTAPTQLDSPSGSARGAVPGSYRLGALLGRGGMGEVLVATDDEIGRDVAIKRMNGGLGSTAEARFLREARIQARLDHPAIVPVHEIGRDSEGRPYFTMKRLTGTTLAAIVQAGTQPQQRLLRAFADVCLAIELAHEKQIIHRDLKPANIMLGDYGEVYVIDWGLARTLDEREPDDAPASRTPTDSGNTEIGALLGTPGYMPPEQARGEPVGPPADVYALGAILFEILAGEPLHPRGAAAISATLERPTQAPTARRPDVPPELDVACQQALAAIPAERPTARELAEHVQRYLDGDRDLERRRVLAAEHLALARQAYATDDRPTAMRAAGRALALDATCHEAGQILTRLTLEPPAQLPGELKTHLAATDLDIERKQWRLAAYTWLTYWGALPLMVLAGIEDLASVFALFAITTVIAGICFFWSRAGRPRVEIVMALSVPVCLLASRLFGPFIFVPAVMCVMGYGFASYPANLRSSRVLIIVLSTFVLILAAEAFGVLAQTWRIVGADIVSQSTLVDLSGTPGKVLLVVTNVVTLLVAVLFAISITRERLDMQHRVEIQAWHLRKLVPDA